MRRDRAVRQRPVPETNLRSRSTITARGRARDPAQKSSSDVAVRRTMGRGKEGEVRRACCSGSRHVPAPSSADGSDVPRPVPDPAVVTPANPTEVNRKRPCHIKALQIGTYHNPRVGGSSPSSGITEAPAKAGFRRFWRGSHWRIRTRGRVRVVFGATDLPSARGTGPGTSVTVGSPMIRRMAGPRSARRHPRPRRAHRMASRDRGDRRRVADSYERHAARRRERHLARLADPTDREPIEDQPRCGAPGCDEVISPHPRGAPKIYCSKRCRTRASDAVRSTEEKSARARERRQLQRQDRVAA